LDSIQSANRQTGIKIITGDTKVVPRAAVDGLFINTAGIGEILSSALSGPSTLKPDDVLIVSGPIGRHGSAILCSREKFDFDPPPSSDCAPLTDPIVALHQANLTPRAMRDATRGGLAAVLFEWAEACGQSMTIDESQVPVTEEVRAVCELLGLEAWHMANEGTFVLATPANLVDATLEVLKNFEVTQRAAVIGNVRPRIRVAVSLIRSSGREVPLNQPTGMPLPRIC
jgi:hydrogenase expression/formation protein HypE